MELVINTLPSYTSISNAAVGKTFSVKMFHMGFMQVLILQSLKSQYYKIFKTLKLSCLQ